MKDEEKTKLEDIEVMEIEDPSKRASIFLYKAGDEALKGHLDNFVRGVIIIEKTLIEKLEGSDYMKNVEKERKKLEESSENPELELAFYKYGELNKFISEKRPKFIRGRI